MVSERVIRPSIFDPSRIVAGFSTRIGGESTGEWQSLNLSVSVGDDRRVVEANRKAFVGDLGYSLDDLAIAGQVHGVHVQRADEPGLYSETDGLVTSMSDLVLCLTAADCASVLFADERAGVVGACHAGWRGAAGNIVARTISEMTELGASTAHIKAYVSPCISLENFEVGEEVAQQFPDTYVDRSRDKPHVDLAGVLVGQLVGEGVSIDRVENAGVCTYSDGRFFSHRAESGRTGRMMGCIVLVG